MKRILLLMVFSLCLALPLATLSVPTGIAQDSTTVIERDVDTRTETDIERTETEVDLSATSDDDTNRILLWGGVILVAALIIGLAMHNRNSVQHTDVHTD